LRLHHDRGAGSLHQSVRHGGAVKEIEGRLIAIPAHIHAVNTVDDMEHDVLYPTSCFTGFPMPRGRKLSDALSQDESAPKAETFYKAKCFTKTQISEYVASYYDEFKSVSVELASALKSERATMFSERSKIEQNFKIFKDELKLEYDVKFAKFVKDFVKDNTCDITHASNSTCGIYFLRKSGSIVYIGQSVNVYSRVAQHRNTKDFDAVDFMPCDKSKLNEIEGFLIRLIMPPQNGYNPNTRSGAPTSSLWNEVVRLPWNIM
jgi:hypothetical protein